MPTRTPPTTARLVRVPSGLAFALAAAALALTAGVAGADGASPFDPWERYRVREVPIYGADFALCQKIDYLRPAVAAVAAVAAVGGGAVHAAVFRRFDGRPLDGSLRVETHVTDRGPGHTTPAWIATVFAVVALALVGLWVARGFRRPRA